MHNSEFSILLMGFVTVVNVMVTGSFYKRIGASLKFTSPDPLTCLFYLQLIFSVIGSYLVVLNIDNTDWLSYLDPKSSDRLVGWIFVQYSFFALSVTMAVAWPLFNNQKLLNRMRNTHFSSAPLGWRARGGIVGLLLITSIAGFYTFWTMGYIPLLKIFESTGTALAVYRSETKFEFQGLSFIRDLFFKGLSQIAALYVFSVYISYKKGIFVKLSLLTSIILVFLSTTSNLEKAGFLFFIISMFSLYAFKGQKISGFGIFAGAMFLFVLLVIAYIATFGDHVHTAYLVSEISGRIFIAQVAGVFMTISAFPDKIPFVGLDGIGVLANMFGFVQSEGAPRLVMSYFWPKEVDLGILGFMSSYFPAEAYGNFGLPGVLVAPVIVGVVTAAYFAIFVRLRNPHIGTACIVYIIFNLPFTSNFSYFYYSPGLLLLVVFVVMFDRLIFESAKRIR